MLKKLSVMRAPFEVGFRRFGLLATHYAGFQAATGVVCSWTVFFCHTVGGLHPHDSIHPADIGISHGLLVRRINEVANPAPVGLVQFLASYGEVPPRCS